MTTYVIILIAVLVFAIPSIILVNKFPKSRIFFQVIFIALIIVFGYLLYTNINKPIKFEKELDKRSDATILKLKDIRTVQIAYKDKYGKYTGSFDTLISFVKTDSFAIPKIVQVKPWNQDEVSKEKAFKLGILKKSTAYVPVKDSIWKKKVYAIDDIKNVPFSPQGAKFSMAAGDLVTGSKVKVQVFECFVSYVDLLEGLDKQQAVNYIDTKTKYGGFPGVKVGSLTEATNNAGNWEQ